MRGGQVHKNQETKVGRVIKNKNKAEETLIIKAKLVLDWMINKKARCQEETFHTLGVLQRPRQLLQLHFFFLFKGSLPKLTSSL